LSVKYKAFGDQSNIFAPLTLKNSAHTVALNTAWSSWGVLMTIRQHWFYLALLVSIAIGDPAREARAQQTSQTQVSPVPDQRPNPLSVVGHLKK
jgi:hypothetical protein